MQVAPEKELFQKFAPSFAEQSSGFPFIAARSRTYVLMSIIGVAMVLRLYGIAAYTLAGDEYGSIIEAKWLGLNWNSIVYSTVMHFWVRLGTSEMWLRLPAAIFGIATVPLFFKIGAKLAGWRAGAVAGLLAATSPFNIYHSQEVRFYSLFMLAAAAFMLTTISYIDSRENNRRRISIVLTGALLLVAHFVGIIALSAQGAATFLAAKKRRLQTVLGVTLGIPLLIFGLPLLPPVRYQLFYLYQAYGNSWNADTSATQLSLLSLAKIAFAGYTLIFGYHVYPFRLLLVIPGIGLFGFLLVRGVLQLKKGKWAALPFTYVVALGGIYVVFDSLGGRVASGVAPRHAAFVWPAFIVLLSLGLASFNKTIFQVLLVAILAINSFSLWSGWQKDWTYGVATDYRAAGAYAASWADKESAMIIDGRASEALDRYFPKLLPLVTSRPGSAEFDQLPFRRLILVTNDWRSPERQQSNELISSLSTKFAVTDGWVDYPLFAYVLDRKASRDVSYALLENGQLLLPPSIYGVEFQDLKLPVTADIDGVPLRIIGAFALPSSDGSSQIALRLTRPAFASRLILLTNIVGLNQSGSSVGEVRIQNRSGAVNKFPLRMDRETTSWAGQCAPTEPCKTVFQWHKRITMVGQNSFPDAWRDFQAGMHAVVLNLPGRTEIDKVSVRYAGAGHLFVWGIALRS